MVLLIEARNAFNEENHMVMILAVRHEWTSVTKFTFNCYQHWAKLVVRDLEMSGQFLHSKEGVTQGDPLSITKYVIGFLPVTR